MFLGLDTSLKQGIFTSYVGLWVTCHLLVYSSQRAGAPEYNATSAVLITELTKMCLAIGLYLKYDGNLEELTQAIIASPMLLVKYAVPALMYCIYNNLVYKNLTLFDPGTYNVLMQLRIAMTGVLFQILFKKTLNRNQWLAILCVTAGCMMKESAKLTAGEAQSNLEAWVLLLIQMVASVFAGVYNEVLLKGDANAPGHPGVTTNLQNCFMYFQSVLWNALFLMYQGKLGVAVSTDNLQTVFSPSVLVVMCIMTVAGMITGFFLKHLDSVLKSVAGACEVVVVMVLSAVLFGTSLTCTDILSALMVGVGVVLYSRPVEVAPQQESTDQQGTVAIAVEDCSSESEQLIDEKK